MKAKERKAAREFRQRGWSINQIIRELHVSKASVSTWVRDIRLSESQVNNLSARGHNRQAIEKRRTTRLANENARRQLVVDAARDQIKQLSKTELFILGVALYWGEGSKTKRGLVELTNSDPKLIRVSMKFFREICRVPNEKFRGHVYLHPHLSTAKAEKYWSEISGIPRRQFYKTSINQSRTRGNKKDKLPNGTFSINICDTNLFLKIYGWTQGIILRLQCDI